MAGPIYNNTVGRAIRQAYENAALIPFGSTPSPNQFVSGLNRMNDMLNHWQTRGLKLMLDVDVPLPALQVAVNFYPLGPGQSGINMTKPLRVIDAYFLQQGGSQVNMFSVSRDEWDKLPNKTTSPGQPVNYFVDKQTNYLGVYLWPSPDSTSVANGQVHLIIQRQIGNPTMLTDQTLLPVEWFRAIHWGLAYELSIGQPDQIVAMCSANADRYLMDLENWDVEDAGTFITVDTRGGQYGNEFA